MPPESGPFDSYTRIRFGMAVPPWAKHEVRLLLRMTFRLFVAATCVAMTSALLPISAASAATVTVRPSDNLAAIVSRSATGTVFVLSSGVHNHARVQPKNDMRFIGEPGAILDGRGTSSTAFSGTGNRVEIRGLEIRNYSPGLFNGPVSPRGGSDWLVADNYIHHNDGMGIRLDNGITVDGNRVSHNRQTAFSALGQVDNRMRDVTITNNEVDHNAIGANFSFSFHEGGMKALYTDGLVVKGNHFHDNAGVAVYCDLFCNDADISDNVMIENGGRLHGGGVFVELSRNVTVKRNFIDGMGSFTSTLWGGVTVAESQNVTVEANEIHMANGSGIQFRNCTTCSDATGSVRRDPVANLRFTSNTVVSTGGNTQVGFNGGASVPSSQVRFDSNRYYESAGHIRFTSVGEKSWTAWKGLGYDTRGSYFTTGLPAAGPECNGLRPTVNLANSWARPSAGDDVVLGTTRADTIDALTGNDTICGGGSADRILGGAGDDVIYSGGGNDSVDAGPGDDIVFGQIGGDTIWGGDGNDTLLGGPGYDAIYGDDGADNVQGAGGNDQLYGGAGNDAIYGKAGNDRMYGEAGNDEMYAAAGNDFVDGGPGADRMQGAAGNDTMSGGSGDDILYGQNDADTLRGDQGNDTLYGAAGDDELNGGPGADNIQGALGSDRLFGESGVDILYPGPGADVVNGGSDSDTCFRGVGDIVSNC